MLAQLPEDADLLSPRAIEMYYQRYYSGPNHQLDMLYKVSVNGYISSTLVDLLSSNRQSVGALLENGHQPERCKDICQAFGTAEAAFEAIPDETIPVLVPYGQGKDKLLALQSAKGGASLLPELQPYTVSISQSQRRQLGDALYSVLDGAAIVLQENYYDSENKGLSFVPSAR